jgi:hypothetical protein
MVTVTPETVHTEVVVDTIDTARGELTDATTGNGASPYVLSISPPKVTVWDARSKVTVVAVEEAA